MKINKSKNRLPGFGLSLGYTIFYISLIVIIPLSTILFSAKSLGISGFIKVISDSRVVSSYKLSFYTAGLSALINVVIGFIIAWTLTRYNFPLKRLFDALVDLPFALPTAVAGITLATILSNKGWIGRYLHSLGLSIVNTSSGIIIALVFVGFPFVVRTVQPVLQEMEQEIEEAAASLGANRFQVFTRVILPHIFPALLTGFTLAFARSLGEYGSVIFISGNIPFKSEITPLLIMSKLDQFDYEGAAAIALTLLLMSFIMLVVLNFLQWLFNKRFGRQV